MHKALVYSLFIGFGSADSKWAKGRLPKRHPVLKAIVIPITVTALHYITYSKHTTDSNLYLIMLRVISM